MRPADPEHETPDDAPPGRRPRLTPTRIRTAAAALTRRLRRPHAPLRPAVRAAWLPAALAGVTALIGLVNIASVLTPDLQERIVLVRGVASAETVHVAHALALQVGVGLLIVAAYLARRRRRAWALATGLLCAVGALDLLKGLDVEEALLSWAAVGLLLWGRESFTVVHAPGGLRTAVVRAAHVVAVAAAVAFATAWVAGGPDGRGPVAATRRAVGLLTATGGTPDGPHTRWVPLAMGILGAAAAATAAALLFAPITAPRRASGPWARHAARLILESHCADTLGFFKLRGDVRYAFSPDGHAFAAYRVEGRVLLVSADPVGPRADVALVIRDLLARAQAHGLRVAFLGAGGDLAPVYQAAGLRRMYIGDEAVIDVASFSLEGRRVRKVRQSVARIERAGYTCEVRTVGSLCADGLAELEAVSARWRGGAPEKGFSMALDGLGGDGQDETLLVIARDADGAARGHLHLVPCFGRAAASLSQMRRDTETPNGLTEYLVVHAVDALRERGIEELSLNFAAFARFLRSPSGVVERTAGRALRRLDRHFQIERLYRFNAKFSPRWVPRYLVWDGGVLSLPRTALAALRAEGQLPRLRRGLEPRPLPQPEPVAA